MKAVCITIILGFIAGLASTISTTFVQALNRSIPDFQLNLIRSIGPLLMVTPVLVKVSIMLLRKSVIEQRSLPSLGSGRDASQLVKHKSDERSIDGTQLPMQGWPSGRGRSVENSGLLGGGGHCELHVPSLYTCSCQISAKAWLAGSQPRVVTANKMNAKDSEFTRQSNMITVSASPSNNKILITCKENNPLVKRQSFSNNAKFPCEF